MRLRLLLGLWLWLICTRVSPCLSYSIIPPGVQGITFSPDGEYLAASGDILGPGMHFWKVNNPGWYQMCPINGQRAYNQGPLEFSTDGQKLLVLAGTAIEFWEPKRCDKILAITPDAQCNWFQLSSDNRQLLTLGFRFIYERQTSEGIVEFWDSASGHLISKQVFPGSPCDAKFTARGALVACVERIAERGSVLNLYNADKNERISSFPVPKEDPWLHVKISPDGKRIALLDFDHIVTYNAVTGTSEQLFLPEKNGLSTDIIFAPDNLTCAIVDGSTVKIERLDTGQHRQTIVFPQFHSVSSVVFSPDSKTLAVGITTHLSVQERKTPVLGLWDATTGEKIVTYR